MSSQEPSKTVCIIIHKTGVVLSDLPLLTLSADSAVRCSRASSVRVTDCNAAARRLREVRGKRVVTTGKKEG